MGLLTGDCRDVLPTLGSGSVQMCVTSPPYWGLRDYGIADQIGLEETPEAYVAQMVAVFREVRRVLRDDGTLWLNLGDKYGGAKGDSDGAKRTNGHDTRSKDLVGIPWRVAFALQADGWYLRQDIIWHKPNPMPESVTDRCTKAHEYLFLMAKSERYYYDAEAVKEDSIDPESLRPEGRNPRGNDKFCQHDPDGKARTRVGFAKLTGKQYLTRNRRSVWTIATQPYSEAHFATFPPALIEPCILAGSRVGDVVLDPFLGSGTTAEVCERLGRQWVGIELNPEYVKLAHRRSAQKGLGL